MPPSSEQIPPSTLKTSQTYLGRSSMGEGGILVDTLIWFSLRQMCLSNKHTPDIPVIVSSY
jgi:hypothetical protein